MTLALVEYVDESNQVVTQLAIVGDKKVQLMESRSLGLAKNTTPKGQASEWLAEGIRKKLGKS